MFGLPFLKLPSFVAAPPSTAVGMHTYATMHERPNPRTFFGQSVLEEQRSPLSATGDVRWVAGPQFQSTFASREAAIAHASSAADGAVAVLQRPGGAAAQYVLHRLYAPELTGRGLDTRWAQLDGAGAFRNVHPAVVAIVDGVRAVTPRA